MTYDFDLFVIGGGSGGIAAARRAAEYGAKVAVAEYSRLGGTCVNRGCVPKKLMVYASRFPELFSDAQGYGWSVTESSLDWSKMITAVNDEVTRLNGIYQSMLDKSKVKLFPTYARFLDEHTLEVGEEKITAEKILIAVGGHPFKPDIPGIEYTIVSDDMFNLKEQPKRMVVLGAGYIAVEFACIMQGLGTEVTLILRGDGILRGFDREMAEEIAQGMTNHGIRICRNSMPKLIEKVEEGFKITIEGDNQEILVADAISLAATGRKPNLDNLGLENTKVEIKDGAIAVDEFNHTSCSHIFAVGDCTDRINLTPVAIKEGRAFADTNFGGKSWHMSYDNVPTAIFTTPEAATVGLSEEEARKQYGENLLVYRAKFRPMYYTLAGKEEKSLLKLLVDTKTDKVLGAHMVGEHAAEIIQGVAIAINMGATKADFDATVAIHSSVAEEFVTMR